MKLNYRKISALATSAIMTISSIGLAAAANYPAPFVDGGSANVAIVYGTGTGVSQLDAVQAGSIQTDLQSRMTGTTSSTTSTSGGDSIKLEKSSTKFRLGKGIADVWSVAITDSDLPNLLADGKYVDDDNDEKDYTQKIDMANLSLEMFDDDDYMEDTPTIGFKVSSASHVMNYTLDFTDMPDWADLASTNIDMMGKNYFILSYSANDTINLLDSGNTASVTEGETAIVTAGGNTYSVSISYISSTEVKLTINGETTNSLQETHTQKLKDDSYVGIKDIMYDSKTGSVSSVEFSIGTGKLVLKDATDIEINDESVSDMKAYFTTTFSSGVGQVDKIVIEWKAEDELFATPDASITMPGFSGVVIKTSGMYYPTEEKITIKGASTTYAALDEFPLKTSTEDINILYGDSTSWTGIGKDATHQLRVSTNASIVYDKDTDDYFVASYNDGSNAESYLMRATDFAQVGTTTANKTTVQYKKDGIWTDAKKDAQAADSISIGNVQLTVNSIARSGTNTAEFAAGSSSVVFHTLYSAEGMQVYLPFNDATNASTAVGALGENATESTVLDIVFSEEDKNGNIGNGGNITATLGWNSAGTPEAYVSDVGNESVTFAENGDNTKKWISHMYTDLASQLIWDKSGDQYELEITYHGDESYGEVFVTAPGVTVVGSSSTVSALGDVLVTDAEVATVSSKNLIIIGGSCINSAAATALGVSSGTCGSAFTDATGVGSGQFLIKGVSGAFTTGKIALVVAGYEVDDTANAATYLRTKTVDTSKEYIGTSATSAELVVATA